MEWGGCGEAAPTCVSTRQSTEPIDSTLILAPQTQLPHAQNPPAPARRFLEPRSSLGGAELKRRRNPFCATSTPSLWVGLLLWVCLGLRSELSSTSAGTQRLRSPRPAAANPATALRKLNRAASKLPLGSTHVLEECRPRKKHRAAEWRQRAKTATSR